MKPPRCPRPLVVLLVPCLGYAAEAPAPAKKPPPPETRGSGGAVSSHISAAIKAQLPAFQPVPAPVPPADTGSAGTGGHPIIMETVIVTQPKKLPDMSEFSMLTKEGQRAYLQKLFPGATPARGDPLDNATLNYAGLMLRDKVRQAHLEKLTDLAETFRRGGDTAGGKRVKEEMQRALIRTPDWQTEEMDRLYNNGRR